MVQVKCMLFAFWWQCPLSLNHDLHSFSLVSIKLTVAAIAIAIDNDDDSNGDDDVELHIEWMAPVLALTIQANRLHKWNTKWNIDCAKSEQRKNFMNAKYDVAANKRALHS